MNKRIFFLFLVLVTTVTSAQRIKIDKKKLQFLKDETKIGVKLTFPEDLIIHRNVSEEEFIEIKKEKLLKRGGVDRVNRWKHQYNRGKQEVWIQEFLKVINKRLERYSELEFTNSDQETDYMLVIEADWIYFGYDTLVAVGLRQEAKLEATLKFVKSSDPKTVLYDTTTPKIIGNYTEDGEFGDIERVTECYKRLGFLLELQLKRVLK